MVALHNGDAWASQPQQRGTVAWPVVGGLALNLVGWAAILLVLKLLV